MLGGFLAAASVGNLVQSQQGRFLQILESMVCTYAELGCRILLGVGSLETTVLKNASRRTK
jgi:hypothetical protein